MRGTSMKNYLFAGGSHDGSSIPLANETDTIQLPVGLAERDTYIRDSLAVGDAFITIYRYESLTRQQALNAFVKHYRAWTVSQGRG
jgi:hypothetical protein